MIDHRSQNRWAGLPLAALVAGALALGSSPILARMSELAPTATAFYRVAFAVPALCLLPLFLTNGDVTRGNADLTDSRVYFPIAAAGILFALDLAFLHWSLRFTSIANSTLLLNSAPLFAGLFGWVLFRERLRLRFLSSFVLAFGGVVLLVRGSSAAADSQGLGNGLALLAGAAYGGYLIAISRLRRQVATGPIMIISSLSCAVCLLPLAIASGESLVPLTPRAWAILIALGLITHAAGQGLVAFAFKALPASTSSAVLLLQPIVAAIGSWLLFGEQLTPPQVLGGVIVLMGVYLCGPSSCGDKVRTSAEASPR